MPIQRTMLLECRRSSSWLLIGLMVASVGGCKPQATNPPLKPSANLGTPTKSDESNSLVLPPQSEPPITDEESTSDDPKMTKPDASDSTEPATTETGTPGEASTTEKPSGTIHVLFDGTNLDRWKRSNFGGEGEVEIVDDAVVLQRGSDMTGIHWTGDPLPKINYEVSLEAQRIDGSDFFCGIVFPVNDAFCSFVAGGWGGSVIGLSSVDGVYAAENETGTYASFKDKTWYKFRLRVSDSAITAWIDGKQYVHLKTKGRKLSLHPAVEPAKPFGVSCYATVAGVKNIQLRELTEEEIAADAEQSDEK